MSIKIHDKLVSANDTFYLVDAEDVEYKGTSIINHLFVVLTETEYYEKLANNEINANTPYLIISDRNSGEINYANSN